jgi:predicted phage terminase large subunit-like protein
LYHWENRVPKPVRIRRLTPLLARGRLRFKADSPGARLLVRQLRDFPNADHDDGPDALEMAVRLAMMMTRAPQQPSLEVEYARAI